MNKYSVIYVNPPRSYRVWGDRGKGRSVESYYSTMSIENIKRLSVGKLADKDCALFVWIAFPPLEEMGEVLRAWGFKYKTVAFVWTKQSKKSDSLFWKMGYRTRTNAEICVLVTKGNPKRYSKGIHQVIVSHTERHSKKPERARKCIEQLMGDVPEIELSAREKAGGQDAWRNGAPDGISVPGLEVV